MSNCKVGRFELNAEQLLLTHDGTPVPLGPKVVATLLALVEHPSDVLSKESLMERIWPDGFVEEANLAQNIHVLRKTFRHFGDPDPIQTVPRRGYRLVVPVTHGSDTHGSVTHGSVTHGPVVGRASLAHASRHFATTGATVAFVLALVILAASSGFGDRRTPEPLSGAAAQQYQVGRYYWNLRTRDAVQRSIGYFARVVELNPTDARGYAGLADANVTIGEYCYGTHRPSVYYARARAYAEKALALDPNSAEAHATLGILALNRKDGNLARNELQRSLALDPSYGPAQEWYGIALLVDGRTSEAVGHLKIAADLDPLSVATIAWLGSAAYAERRFGDAITYSRQALELSPRRIDALATIGEAYEAQGDFEGAIAAFKRFGSANEFYRPEAAALLARVYALGHRAAEARAQLAYAVAHAGDVDPADLAAAAEAVGDRSRAAAGRSAHTHALRAAIFA